LNNIWSSNIQGINTLYLSRKLRFNDLFFGQYKDLFCIDKETEIKILEIGCGPGALAGALKRWYPKACIVGIDRDSEFIEYARKNEKDITFIEGDATNLPFDDNSFDVIISNTVSEHVEPSIFSENKEEFLNKEEFVLCFLQEKDLFKELIVLE